MIEHLPIHKQVNYCLSVLGNAIRRTHGDEMFQLVESVRRQSVAIRDIQGEQEIDQLTGLLELLEKLPDQDKLLLGKAFSIYLMLVNACENAYRTARLKENTGGYCPALKGTLIWVLTAHPTEIRSYRSIYFRRRITRVLIEWFQREKENDPLSDEKQELTALINLIWKLGIHKTRQVTPVDEIRHMTHMFSNEILAEILHLRRHGANLRFRTWVGGG